MCHTVHMDLQSSGVVPVGCLNGKWHETSIASLHFLNMPNVPLKSQVLNLAVAVTRTSKFYWF